MAHFISVIIPVYNASEYVEDVLNALLNQSWQSDSMEIIVIDNGSLDDTAARVEKFPVTLLFEAEKSGPYAARNKGFRHAKGDIIALTDANKIPEINWIKEGVKALIQENADLAGGDIQFSLGENPAAAEVYDAITFNDNRKFVFEEQAAAAGNLFFRRGVLDKIGDFPEGFRSGMDIWWTRNAVQQGGFKLVFAEKARVWCKPRSIQQLLKKSYRVGKTHPFNQKQAGLSTAGIVAAISRTFLPPKIKPIREKISQLSISTSITKVWLSAWLSKKWMGLGRIHGFIMLNKKRDR